MLHFAGFLVYLSKILVNFIPLYLINVFLARRRIQDSSTYLISEKKEKALADQG